jgi:CheY-like chemotaxis protein
MSGSRCVSVLVVSEDDDTRDTITSFLLEEGFHTFSAKTSRQAIVRLAAIPRPALLLADLLTPQIEAWALVGAMDEHDRLATLPVVLVSANHPTAEDGCRYVKRPIELGELLPIVSEFCVRRA